MTELLTELVLSAAPLAAIGCVVAIGCIMFKLRREKNELSMIASRRLEALQTLVQSSWSYERVVRVLVETGKLTADQKQPLATQAKLLSELRGANWSKLSAEEQCATARRLERCMESMSSLITAEIADAQQIRIA